MGFEARSLMRVGVHRGVIAARGVALSTRGDLFSIFLDDAPGAVPLDVHADAGRGALYRVPSATAAAGASGDAASRDGAASKGRGGAPLAGTPNDIVSRRLGRLLSEVRWDGGAHKGL